MITVKGDIINVKYGIVCHQVNAKGVMGAGLARLIRIRWMNAYHNYLAAYNSGRLKLGEVIFSNVIGNDHKLQVASMCAQKYYGDSEKTSIVYTDYHAFKLCLTKVKAWHITCIDGKLPIYFPYGIGCGLAGGNWSTIEQLIASHFPQAILVKKD